MRIGIIGAGFTGLSAAYQLAKKGHVVTVFEKDSAPGGLAVGYKEKEWDWSLEKHYHHWFTNDNSVLRLASEINVDVLTKRPKTSSYVNGVIYQLDSPKTVLTFPKLTIFERIRMASVLAALRFNPFWKPLENYTANKILPVYMGEKAYKLLWKPLMVNKFGAFADEISLAWFWARIKKRTSSLAYPEGGYLQFANELVNNLKKNNVQFFFNTEVKQIKSTDNVQISFDIRNLKFEIRNFDKVIVTLPSFFFIKIAPQLPQEYKQKLLQLKGLGAINLVLRFKKQFLKDGTYWLSVCDASSPIMAVVEHTNFMDKKYYNNEHLVYLGNYVAHDHQYMTKNEHELLEIFDPFLKKLNPSYKHDLIGVKAFKTPFAQPIIPINYSHILPPLKTPLRNVYLANIQQVYPWDRGTNYAVELGEKVTRLIEND